MFAEILFLIVGLLVCASRDAKYRQKIKECVDKGMLVKTNSSLENSLFQDYCFKYQHQDKSDVPEKYRHFFMFNGKAMYNYFMLLAARDVWKQGYRPYLFSIMPKEGFDFLEAFRNKYDKEVAEFNATLDVKS